MLGKPRLHFSHVILPAAVIAIAEAVEFARSNGIDGVGQSSWGPAVFALCEDSRQAEWLAGLYGRFGHYGLWIATPSHAGAKVQVCVEDS